MSCKDKNPEGDFYYSKSSRIFGIKVELNPPSKMDLILNPLAQPGYKFTIDDKTPTATKVVVYTAVGAIATVGALGLIKWFKS